MEEKEIQNQKIKGPGRLKLTPLNIVSAVFLVVAVWLLLEDKPIRGASVYVNVSGFFVAFCFLVAIIAFISDQIFRRFVPDLKKIWIIESFFVFFTLLLMVIIRASTS